MMNTYTGEFHLLEAKPAVIPEGHVLIEGTPEDVERIASTVSAKYREQRKAKNKAAKKSRHANR